MGLRDIRDCKRFKGLAGRDLLISHQKIMVVVQEISAEICVLYLFHLLGKPVSIRET
jgi:hypothetical protein